MENTSKPGRAALEVLYRQARTPLRRLAGRYVRGPEAEDAVQDACVKLLAAGEAVREPSRFLAAATRSLALDRLRRDEVRSRGRAGHAEVADAPDRAPDPESAAGTALELRRLRAALADLPEPCRRALLLSRLEGLTHLEVAARLCISPKTVERHVVRALRHCLERLAA